MSDIDKSFQILGLYGVPRERAKTVHNGIEVLITRLARENEAIRANAESDRALLEDAVKMLDDVAWKLRKRINITEYYKCETEDAGILHNINQFLARARERGIK